MWKRCWESSSRSSVSENDIKIFPYPNLPEMESKKL